jgi:FtsP/CotA-like multicopper oxidase with cupredoxin domain
MKLSAPLLATFSLLVLLLAPNAVRAEVPHYCEELGALYPQPGRTGAPGENAFRPLPEMAPIRGTPGAPGTINLSITADHVSTAPAGKPGYVYVGNYPVTDIPVFRITPGAATSLTITNPETGATRPVLTACLVDPDWAFSGTQWSLVQGDTLDVMFSSRLDYTGPDAIQKPTNGAVPCRSSNLHTHGLLISPYHPHFAGLGPYGDYVLDTTQPIHNGGYNAPSDNCGTKLGDIPQHGHGLTNLPLHYVDQIPGSPGINSLQTGEHPSGLFWYHPHPHGYSQPQVAGGTTGAITVGALTDYACPAGDGTPGSCTLTDTNVRVLALKDTQIKPAGTGPDGTPMWATIHSSDSGFCAVSGGIRNGECQSASAATPGKLIVTVNGVQFPTMHAAAGRMEIWRIINASSTMSYGLTISPQANGAAGATPLPFQVLATDGVSIRPNQGPDMRTELLVMPASRVEIAIPAPAQGGAYVLHDVEVQTGQHGSGDIWPYIDIARIVWDKPAAGTAAITPIPRTVQVAGPAIPVPHAQANQAGIRPACQFAPGDTRVIYFVHRFFKSFGPGPTPTTSATALENAEDEDPQAARPPIKPPSGVTNNVREIFGLIAGIRRANGSMDFWGDDGTILHSVRTVWLAGIHSDFDFPGFGHNNWGTICTVKGNVEPWELVNWTGEDHNFHIHQTRFTLDPNGIFQFPDPALEPTEDPGLRSTDAAVRDFLDPQAATSYHDTIPVPRGQSLCRANPAHRGCDDKPLECSGSPDSVRCKRPGIISVIMDFSRNEQAGTFVYHCHILEHEDGGMMSMIHVLCPPGDASCAAQQVDASICRFPQNLPK